MCPPSCAIAIVRSNLDERVLCELGLGAAPDGAVRIVKLCDDVRRSGWGSRSACR
jgi:hypothetical protein